MNRLNGMRVFAHVVEAKSFSAAAQRLGISKSLASRHVSALERSLAVKLLNRSTRRLSLTEAGALFYDHCANIVQEAELAEQRVTRAQAEPAGTVTVTTIQPFAVRHLVPALAEFHAQFPKIHVKLSCTNRTVDLGDERFDLGIRVSFNPASHLVARKLARNRAVLCASRAYIGRRGMPRRIEDLEKHDCILFPPVTPKGQWTLRRAARKVVVPVSGALESDDMEVVLRAVAAGLGISVLPLYMTGDALQRGELVPVLPQYEPARESGIYLVYLPNRSLPSRVRALIDYLVARFGPVPPWEKG